MDNSGPRDLPAILSELAKGSSLVDKILVGLKRVVDYNVRVRVRNDGSGVDTDGVKMSINPFDEIALEEALRIKESGNATEVIVVSVGATADLAYT